LTIPEKSQIVIDISPDSSPSPGDQGTSAKTESVHGLYCPFCGAFTGKDAVTCSSCRRPVDQEIRPSSAQSPLTTVDWLLITVLAPSGLLTGFVLLLAGKKKGLDMVGIAAASILIWWFVFIVLGWIA